MSKFELPETKSDLTLATKHDVDQIITKRLIQFHGGLVERGQIRDIPPRWPAEGYGTESPN